MPNKIKLSLNPNTQSILIVQKKTSKTTQNQANPQQHSQLQTNSKQISKQQGKHIHINKDNNKNVNKIHIKQSHSSIPKILPLPQLMSRLSHYRDMKQIPLHSINMLNNNNPNNDGEHQKLWKDSPCSYPFVQRHISVDRVKKFTIGSIYFKDNINEQKKVFTEFEKPELLLRNFRRQIEQASRDKKKYSNQNKNNSNQKSKHKSLNKLRNTTSLADNKFYQVPTKTELKFDRHGTRSIFQGDYDIHQIKDIISSKKSNFTSSQRMDLGLPLNFNPGPGKYFNQNEKVEVSCVQSYRAKINSKISSYENDLKSVRHRHSLQLYE